MENATLKSGQNIHALGLSYIYSYLSRQRYIIYEVNTDPNHHFQIMAKRGNDLILVAVRSACHPNIGTIDKALEEQLIKESDRLNAIPHFAAIAVSPIETDQFEIDGIIGGKEYEVSFDGITVIRPSSGTPADSRMTSGQLA